MRILRAHSDSADTAARMIRDGGVVILPTDTIYGFSAAVPGGDARIRAVKGRSETKPFIELIAGPQDAALYTDQKIPEDLFALWPGPLTIIVRRKETLGGGTVAFRCPGDGWLRSVIKKAGCPVYSTSVNRSGCAPLWQVDEIEAEFGADVDLIVDDGDRKGGTASTVVDISGGALRVLRQGAVEISADGR